MDRIRTKDLRSLLAYEGRPCVSLFLPQHPTGRDGMEDAVHLRNAADQAEALLVERGMRRPEARDLMAPVRSLPDDDVAWQKRGASLAIFVAPGMLQVFRGNGTLAEGIFVEDRFHVRPLVPQVMDNGKFFVLALSQKSPRLFEGHPLGLDAVEVPGLPASLEEALNIDVTDRGSQVHSAMRGSQGKQAGVFHGQGGKPETAKDDLKSFLRLVAQAVDQRLNGERAPLILATVASTAPLYREVSRYPHLLTEVVAGNPDHLTGHELHAKAWPLVEPALAREREMIRRRLHTAEGSAKASLGLYFVVPEAIRGKIDTLFVDCARPWWGKYDRENETIKLHAERQPGDDDLVELATVATLKHGGRVFAITPSAANADAAAEALLRY